MRQRNYLMLFKKMIFWWHWIENGKQWNSEELAEFIQQRANNSTKNLIFLIGGAYGLHETVLKRCNYKWSLSKLVFPHQLVRLYTL